MRRVALPLVLSLVMTGALLGPAGMALATPHTPVDDTLTILPLSATVIRVANGIVFLDFTATGVWTGTVNGVADYELRAVIHPNGNQNAQGSGTFTGTVDGRTGTAAVVITGTGDGATAWQHGQVVMGHGTDGLAGLHFQGTWEGPYGGPLSIKGRLHFDP